MTRKCNCNNCSVHIEFEEKDAGQTVTCPNCGLETQLYIPQTRGRPTPEFMAAPAAPKPPTHPQSYLADIRSRSCYKTLRGVLNVTFWTAKSLVVIAALMSAAGSFMLGMWRNQPPAQTIALCVGTVFLAFLLAVLLHAAHQAALLLIDIADCSIRSVYDVEHPPVTTVPLQPATL